MRTIPRLLIVLLLCTPVVCAEEAHVQPGDNLVVEGVPPIPASLAETVARYTDYRAAFHQSWHPIRREMLITTRFGDTYQAHLVKEPGGIRYQLTFFPDGVGGVNFRPHTGAYFVFSKDSGGNERYQKHRYDFSSGEVALLTDGTSRNTGGIFSHNGTGYVYQSIRRTGRDNDLYLMDPSDPATDHLLAEVKGGGWFAVEWSPDDRWLVVGEYISINETYLWLFDAESGAKKLVTPKGGPEKVAYLGAAFSKDGKSLYVTTDKDSEFQRLASVDLDTGQHTYLTSHINWDVDQFELSPDGRTIAFVTNENGAGVLRLLDTATGKEKPMPKLPGGSVFGPEWHENSRDLAFQLITARSSVDVYSLDVSSGQVDRWTFSETGGVNLEDLPDPEIIRWKSFDDKMISGILYRPPARFQGKRPVIISIHGGPEGQARPGFRGRNNYFLNELGVVLIYPNVRGSAGFGKTFLQLDNGMKREHSYWDIGTLFDWLKTQPELDSDRIMVMGGSYGGFMTLAVATNYADHICCAVDVVGISNLATFLENTRDYRRDLRRAEYGDERDPEMRAFMERIAPVNNTDKIAKPLFVIQGANDPRVPLSESEQMVESIRQQGTAVWYLMAKDEGHGFAKKKNRDFQFYATVLFVQEHLLK